MCSVETDLLLSHLGELVEKGEVLGQVFAVGLHAVLHDGQEGLNEASDAGPAADVFNRTVHVVRAETQREEEEEEDDEMFSEQIQPVGPL